MARALHVCVWFPRGMVGCQAPMCCYNRCLLCAHAVPTDGEMANSTARGMMSRWPHSRMPRSAALCAHVDSTGGRLQ